jgi:putative membrane protein
VRLFLTFLVTAGGAAVAVALIALYGAGDIGAAIHGAGWGLLVFVAFHLVQTLFSGLAWRALLPQQRCTTMLWLRWIREAVNALLPVAQIGGELVGARLLRARGVTVAAAGASVTVDLTLEMMSQIAFTLLGLVLLVRVPQQVEATRWIAEGTLAAAGVVVLLLIAQRLGVVHLIERVLVRLSSRAGWSALGEVRGLHAAIATLYRRPARLCLGFMHHLISWLLGGIELMLALYLLGVPVDLGDALVIESLGQAVRAVGFAVPGALGVQEGGNVLVCGLVGIGPQAAIELSLLKRIREVALGVPGLLAWQFVEGRLALRRRRAAARPHPSELRL